MNYCIIPIIGKLKYRMSGLVKYVLAHGGMCVNDDEYIDLDSLWFQLHNNKTANIKDGYEWISIFLDNGEIVDMFNKDNLELVWSGFDYIVGIPVDLGVNERRVYKIRDTNKMIEEMLA